ncbi:putative olfactory receptor 6N2-like [Scophthalmus maximus]|uniref:Putative olfactory receptor 6N2-like n=1 Tax=Scophthalmus maximus TaxID=52904 RepID=A0A2U9C8C9_SCOMX|nr:putative olfactory receptor 6N2-like [Scophthalmus maximus]
MLMSGTKARFLRRLSRGTSAKVGSHVQCSYSTQVPASINARTDQRLNSQIYIIYTYASYELTILGIMAYDRQIYIIYTYAGYEFTILGIMAYDRKRSSEFKSKVVRSCLPHIVTFVNYSITVFCDVALSRINLEEFSALQHSTQVPASINARTDQRLNSQIYIIYTYASYELTILGIMAYDRQIYIIYTYASYELTILGIMAYDRKRSSEFKRKVVRSCLPHIVTFINYSIAVFCDIALSRINLEEVNPFLGVTLSMEFVVIPPILNPLVGRCALHSSAGLRVDCNLGEGRHAAKRDRTRAHNGAPAISHRGAITFESFSPPPTHTSVEAYSNTQASPNTLSSSVGHYPLLHFLLHLLFPLPSPTLNPYLSAHHGSSVPNINNLIPSSDFSMQYTAISAFKVLPIHPNYRHLFGVL